MSPEDLGRFRSSQAVGAHFWLTPKKYQPVETDVAGRISKIGHGSVRTALYEAANVILTRVGEGLGAEVLGHASRRPRRHAQGEGGAPLKLAVVLPRTLVDETKFAAEKAAAAN